MKSKKSKLPISVFIITQDEEDRLPYTLDSLKGWVDEIIVVDSGSKDDTVKIAKKFGATKVVYNEWKGYGPQKVYGEGLCKNHWILNLDADEAVSPKLRKHIKFLFNNGVPDISGYRLNIKIMGLSDKKPRFLAPDNSPIRLYDKRKAGFSSSTVHDSVIVRNGSISKIPGYVEHRCFRSHAHALDKINKYSTMLAEDMFKRGKKPKNMRIILEPFAAFFKAYFMRRYIFLGVDGFIQSFIYAISRVMRLAKARELFLKNKK